MMDPVFGGLNLQDTLAVSDPLAVLVLLGAVAGAFSLSVTRGINTCPAEAGGHQPPRADDFVTAWLDGLLIPSLADVFAMGGALENTRTEQDERDE